MSNSNTSRDYYEILEIEPTATSEEIERAYRGLSMYHHPDRMPDAYKHMRERAQENMKLINEAKEVLLDPERRRLYDYQRLVQEQDAGSGTPYVPYSPYAPYSEPPPPKTRPSKRPPKDPSMEKPDTGASTLNDEEWHEGSNSRIAPVYGSIYTSHPALYPFRRDMASEPGLPSWLAALVVVVILFLISSFQVVQRLEALLPLHP